MKSAKCILQVTANKKTAYFDIFIQRTSDEIFNMGNSSFLINCNKNVFKNGKLEFQCKKYSSGGYEPMQFTQYSFNCIGLQIRCNTLGKQITDKNVKITTIKFSLNGNPSNVSWRLLDTAVVTPAMETVDTNFILNFK